MSKTVFIHTNNKQILGAILAKYAIESRLEVPGSISVKFINVDELPIFKDFIGTEYVFSKTENRIYTSEDLQSFTLSRFMPPELMGYEGKAIVIDPDIFALCDIEELFEIDLGENALAACRKKDAWDTSVMLMDCGRLKHWSIEQILRELKSHTTSYSDVMTLRKEESGIQELPRIWNNLDEYTPETKIIHMTNRLNQPWRTGLPIDFTRNKMPKILGIIPREPIYSLFGKIPSTYQPHPNQAVEQLFFNLVRSALQDGAVTAETVQKEIDLKHVRQDLLQKIF